MSDKQDCHNLICRQDPLSSLRATLRNNFKQKQCPLNRSQLGFYSWSILHSFAAYYPDRPSPEDKESILGLLKAFRNLYPCTHCRPHFQRDYDKDPPNVESCKQLSQWMCRQHNRVNKMLGKPQFDCDHAKLMERWKTGCQNEDEL